MDHQVSESASSTLVPFPLKARASDVQRAAALLMMKSLSQTATTDHWVRITDRLAKQLGDYGFDPIVIAMELCDFEDAVDEEIARRQTAPRRH